jgi:alpha-N-arabinofuranosidase
LNGIEFARGPSNSTWGSVRAAMGHPDPFNLKYVAIGNEDCGKPYYRGVYLSYVLSAGRMFLFLSEIQKQVRLNVEWYF